MNAHEMFLQQALNLVRLHLKLQITSKSTNNSLKNSVVILK